MQTAIEAFTRPVVNRAAAMGVGILLMAFISILRIRPRPKQLVDRLAKWTLVSHIAEARLSPAAKIRHEVHRLVKPNVLLDTISIWAVFYIQSRVIYIYVVKRHACVRQNGGASATHRLQSSFSRERGFTHLANKPFAGYFCICYSMCRIPLHSNCVLAKVLRCQV